MKIFRNVLGIIALALALHPLVLQPAWSWWAQAAPATGPAGSPATSASSPTTTPHHNQRAGPAA